MSSRWRRKRLHSPIRDDLADQLLDSLLRHRVPRLRVLDKVYWRPFPDIEILQVAWLEVSEMALNAPIRVAVEVGVSSAVTGMRAGVFDDLCDPLSCRPDV